MAISPVAGSAHSAGESGFNGSSDSAGPVEGYTCGSSTGSGGGDGGGGGTPQWEDAPHACRIDGH